MRYLGGYAMALKDLAIKEAALTEKQVEDIVSKYVRYDVEKREIHFLFDFTPLKTRNKVLVYLVALHGWPFLTNESAPLAATPAAIGKSINVDGGTLRPALKALKDAHIISPTGKMYGVQSAAFGKIREILEGGGHDENVVRRPKKTKKGRGRQGGGRAGEENQGRKKSLRDLQGLFDKFIADGFFDQPRVIGDLKDRFAEIGETVPLTTLSGMLKKAAREKLTRKKKEIARKRVWVYKRRK
jgi:hypothetical protein